MIRGSSPPPPKTIKPPSPPMNDGAGGFAVSFSIQSLELSEIVAIFAA